MNRWRIAAGLLCVCLFTTISATAMDGDAMVSQGRQADPTAKTLSELHAAELRQIPLEVMLKSADHFSVGKPVMMTVVITNLFDNPLLMNSRMLVNHPLLQGEISFRILGPDHHKVEIVRLITPLSVRDNDFVILERGQSMQRSVDLSDLFTLTQKGTYKVQVSYHNEVDRVVGSQRAWKGIVWSDPLEIELK